MEKKRCIQIYQETNLTMLCWTKLSKVKVTESWHEQKVIAALSSECGQCVVTISKLVVE